MLVEQIQLSKKMTMKTYSFEEAFEKTLQYFGGDQLAARVWVNKYALKDSFTHIFELSPDDMHRRLAKEIARVEKRYPKPLSEDDVFALLKDFKYLVPQGGPMTGIGNRFQVASLSNCFVIGNHKPSDSYGGIMKIDQEQVQLMKRRGGVGHDLSHIRPAGSPVYNSALTSTGVVPFMERYSNSTREVAQDGRRGALMLSISIKHPDSENFIDAKLKHGKITGANVSVKIDDEFMHAVASGKPYVQQFPIGSDKPLYTKEIDARKLWDKITHNAWKSAEPGILFWDTVIRESVADSYADLGYRTVSTNPCGEIPLCPDDSCRLLALNLFSYVENPFTPQAEFDFELFSEHVRLAQRIMDDIIDLELEKIDGILAKIASDPEEEDVKRVERNLWLRIQKKAREGRRTGVGITAEGDMLAALNLRYGTEEAIQFSVKMHKTKAVEAYRSSINMAKERGAFTIYSAEREQDNPFILRLKEAAPKLYQEMVKHGRRNISLLTIAPTGTTSLMTQTSSGVEPAFMLAYKRRRKVNPNDKGVTVSFTDKSGDSWEEYNVFHHNFLKWMEINGYDTGGIRNYSDRQINELIEKSPYHKATSGDVNWLSKVKMQGEIQKWIDHSISVTVNLPSETPQSLVGELYMKAWQSGCKGITVYRDGSRDGVLVGTSKKTKEKGNFRRPKELEADIIHFQNNREKWIAFIGMKDGRPYEIFTGIDNDEHLYIPRSVKKGLIIKQRFANGNKRYDFQFQNKHGFKTTIEGLSFKFDKDFWNYAKLISGVLRQGMPIVKVVNLIASLHLDNESINTWKNGVERALRRYIPNGTKAKHSTCQSCGSDALIYQEGCLICQNCGSSKCG